MRFIVLLFFAEVLREMSEDGSRVGGAAFECRDAAGAAPAIATLHAHNDVLIKESAFLQKSHGRFGSKFVRSEFADADEITQPLRLIRLSQLEERLQTVHLALRGRLAVL